MHGDRNWPNFVGAKEAGGEGGGPEVGCVQEDWRGEGGKSGSYRPVDRACRGMIRAGHFRYFLIFCNNKK